MKQSTAIKAGLASAATAVLLTLGGPVGNALADSAADTTSSAPTSGEQSHEVVDCGSLSEGFDVDFEMSEEEVVDVADLTEEDVAQINADGQALMDAFDAAGIAYATVTDIPGLTFPEWDYGDKEAEAIAGATIAEFKSLEFGIELFAEELSEEEVAEANEVGHALADELSAAGVTYTLRTDESGITFPEWDFNDEQAGAIADRVLSESDSFRPQRCRWARANSTYVYLKRAPQNS